MAQPRKQSTINRQPLATKTMMTAKAEKAEKMNSRRSQKKKRMNVWMRTRKRKLTNPKKNDSSEWRECVHGETKT